MVRDGKTTPSRAFAFTSRSAVFERIASSTVPGWTTTACIQRWRRSRPTLAAIGARRPRVCPAPLAGLERLGVDHAELRDVLVPLVEGRGRSRARPGATVEP